MTGLETNRRAGQLADMVAGMLVDDGIQNALVTVNLAGALVEWPLAVRTPKQYGWGEDSGDFYGLLMGLGQRARQQAKYAMVVDGRSAQGQREKLEKIRTRNAASYGINFPGDLEPGFAHDPEFGLTVVAVVENASDLEIATKYSQEAVNRVNKGEKPGRILEAARLVKACLGEMDGQLPRERSGVVMLGLSKRSTRWLDILDRGPAVVCAETTGLVVSPATYSIVESKLKAVVVTRGASGLPREDWQLLPSQIVGGIPLMIEGLGYRAMAAGGLPAGEADIAAIIGGLHAMPVTMRKVAVADKMGR